LFKEKKLAAAIPPLGWKKKRKGRLEVKERGATSSKKGVYSSGVRKSKKQKGF